MTFFFDQYIDKITHKHRVHEMSIVEKKIDHREVESKRIIVLKAARVWCVRGSGSSKSWYCLY